MNAGSGVMSAEPDDGRPAWTDRHRCRASDSNVIYAQAQSIAANTAGNCGAPGCQLGVWATTNGGTSWLFMAGSQGPSLGDCGFDYPQNWFRPGSRG